MNQIYNIIFSKVKGCLVAVGENVTGQGKGKSKSSQVGGSSTNIKTPAIKFFAGPARLIIVALSGLMVLMFLPGEALATCINISIDTSAEINPADGSCYNVSSGVTVTKFYISTFDHPPKNFTINNSGSVESVDSAGVVTFNNSGVSHGVYAYGGINFTNQIGGIVSVSSDNWALALVDNGDLTVVNHGTISILDNGVPGDGPGGILSLGTGIFSATNTGSITGGDYAAGIASLSSSTNSSVVNSGIISVGIGGFGIINGAPATLTTVTNTGTISAGTGGYGIANLGTITTLNNAQGVGNSAGPLTYAGNLPANYNIIILGSSYGQLNVATGSLNINNPIDYQTYSITGGTGSTNFGIYSGSTLSAGTYSAVLMGIDNSKITNYGSIYNVWNNFNSSYKWELVDGSNASTWNLLVAYRSPISGSGSIYQSSSLDSTASPVFDGGTLKVSSAGTIANNIAITGNNGVINQNGLSSNFSGDITDSGVGVQGKLTITNPGTTAGSVTLSGNNTYSGGTFVGAGANLSISSANNIGTGGLDLVGSSTMSATLTTTATMTIANSITVAGDSVFDVASGTTTTISSPIIDGSSAGDVIVQGGGTLALTAANTYSGPTYINSGSALALSGAGSIASSSGLTNNGTFNITGKTGNVSIANYTQGSSGTLTMNLAPSGSQQLNVTGATSLAGNLILNAAPGSYKKDSYTTILTSSGGITGKFDSLSTNLGSYTNLGYYLTYDANDVYLFIDPPYPTTADTQQSLVNTAASLQSTFALQNSVLANSFSYDCTEFGTHGVCISAGGRNTAVSAANGLNNTSGLLIAAYRPHPNYRIGAYADQNLSVKNTGSTVTLGNNTPLIGLFGAWNQRLDGTGTEVKVSAAYGQKNTTVTRQVVGTSEAGSGSSQLNSQGAQVTAKHGFAVTDKVIVSPYLGMRYTQNNMGGYTEGSSASVTAPLTYSALNTNATTALAGVGASYQVIPKVTTFASLGIETDTNKANGSYYGTNSNIAGLTPVNFNANPVKTRPTATLGAYYDVAKNQRLGITGIYRQESYQAVSTTTVMATYSVGF
jgi:autotransporter-associated beta strand protein